MQTLRAAEGCRQGLEGDAHHVVDGLLRGQGGAARLGVEAQHHGLGIGGAETLLHDRCPEAARRTELGGLFKQVVMGVKEEGQARGEFVERQSGRKRRLDVGNAIRQGEGDFLHRRRSRFTNVITGNRNGVPIRHFFAAIREGIHNESHGRPWRIDVGAASDVLLQNVVLDGAAQLVAADSLLFRDQLVEQQQGARGGVDGHRRRHVIQRQSAQQEAHVVEGANGHAHFPHFAFGTRVVSVVTHLRGQVKGAGQTGLSCR